MDSMALSKVNILKSETIGLISISYVYIHTRTFCVKFLKGRGSKVNKNQ